MTPSTHSWNSRSLRPGKIRGRSRSSPIALSSAASLDASPRLDLKPFSTLPSCKRTGDHRHASHNSIWTWISDVDRGQQPLLDHTEPLLSDSLQVPCDVGMDRDLYSSPRTVPSSLNTHLSAAEMSAPGSSRSSPLPDQRLPPFDSASYSSDRITEGCLNDWQHVMDESPSFFASSPCPSSCSSTMGFTSTLPRDPNALDETMYRTLLDQWSDSEEWRGNDRERDGSISGSDTGAEYNADAYPRSAACSPLPSDIEMQPAVLPALLDQQEFSTLMLQSFTLALADAALEESDGFELFKIAAEAEMEDDRGSDRLYPPHLHDSFDFSDQWSPPALRSSSSASSLDPFHLDLFSPASEQTDPAAVWESHKTPGDSSDSREYFSSSPFVRWSSSSDAEMKPALFTLGGLPMSAAPPLSEVPLYQPQPIRPIPPIDIPANLIDELPEGGC